ncbi:hypothetical protein HMPREF9318_00491 [Streptococcus urinalis FB127-CNA-2]|uniref:Oxidoreductase, FAD/FMN dependent n=1 Tax=Streptococcus urinalis 2285-97 TaxID=764291 RepID=G5KG83_9STRE|nr:NADH-dependent flavin oxidoreductase [Streptococcus urinalis]EHJ56116.1 oxidoreductase, FAD/FMN dependent [Streptococcus urinalis 2285-97]EKS22293.1 hypothetical protein HMPREF9318_00491 [Streptococcus urinalis FB127-CNA-2]VEF32105.1 Probable NADH-dependent flavin oxidoreductase in cluster with COG2110 [Streptococcus urinalis]
MKEKYNPLFSPVKLANGLTLNNRFVLSPMVTNSSTSDGFITDDDLKYAARRSHSAPLQITGAAYVNRHGQLFEFGFSACKDEDIPGLAKLAKVMKSEGAKAILQLTHAGRFSTHALNHFGYVYGPSEMILQSPFRHKVKALTIDQIKSIVNDYALATKRAILAGFDGIEISSAQRLLIQTFFSTFSNQRQDDYGCQNLVNRSRFGLEIFEAIQNVIYKYANNQFILGFRATPEETRGSQIGYQIEEFMDFLDCALDQANIDYLAIASWGHDVYKNKVRAAGQYQGQLITQVIHQNFRDRLPIMATGGINTSEKALEALENSDLIGASTPFIVDPEFVEKIKIGNDKQIRLKIAPEELSSLAIPSAAFKDIVPLMDYGESLPKESRDLFRGLYQKEGNK